MKYKLNIKKKLENNGVQPLSSGFVCWEKRMADCGCGGPFGVCTVRDVRRVVWARICCMVAERAGASVFVVSDVPAGGGVSLLRRRG